jgi:primary-amine oxidase
MAFGMRRTFSAAILAVLCAVPDAAAHPLDPLSPDDIRTAIAVLRDQGLVDAATRFPLIDLDEPDKAAVMAWQPGRNEFRKAFVVARRDRTVYEGVVDLAARKVASWRAVPGVESGFLVEEWEAARRITLSDPGWQAAMQQRGYQNFDRISCAPLSPGPAVDPSEAGRRLLRVACFDEAGAETLWSRPIEGLIAVVDLDAGRVLRLIDTGPVPVPGDRSRLPETPAAPPASPALHDFTIDGSGVNWGAWSFHFRLDRRAGLIVSLLRYADRMVLYRGSLAEMFVPYRDADPAWSFRAFMDEGEWGLGLAASPLKPGIDCPADAAFLDAVLADDRGSPLAGKSVICLFERHTGAPLWRHFETASGAYAGQPATELVIRTIPSLGNYDYIIDWVLNPAGMIRIDVGATGIDAVKAVAAPTGDENLIAPDRVGVDHDHFLSFRLDLDIDGAANTLVRRRLVRDGARWRPVDTAVTHEGPLGAGMDGAGMDGAPEIWRVVNPALTNGLGGHPGYELHADHSATSLLPADDPAQQRAAFSSAPLWLTAYDRAELYAAGPYLGKGDGLPAYAAKQRPVEGADIVLWPTIGFHHLPRPEDWPVLPVMWHSLSLVPDGFFDRNPSLAAPEK